MTLLPNHLQPWSGNRVLYERFSMTTKVSLKTTIFFDESSAFSSITWEQLHSLTFLVARQILEADLKVDRIVTLAKGGWTMTCALVDFLGVYQTASVGMRFYTGINERLEKPEIYQDIPVSIKDENILLFDDIADTGASLIFAKKYLMDHGANSVVTATTLYKPHSTYKPDFYGAETNDWVIFPYDVAETVKNFSKNWKAKGHSPEEIKERLLQLQFSKTYITFFKNKN